MYLSFAEYQAMGLTPSMTADDFGRILPYAEGAVDAYTFDVIQRDSLMEVPYFANKVKRAVGYQIAYSSSIGLDAVMGSAKDITSESESMGNYSRSVHYAQGLPSGALYVNGMPMAPLALTVLSPIRAMGRQVKTC